MQKTLRTITFLCLTLLIAPILVAQDMVLENREDATAPTFFGESGLFQTTSGTTLQQGEWSFGAYLNQFRYTMADGRDLRIEHFPSTRRAYQDMSVIEDRFSASLGYGITDRWEINMQFPLVTVSSDEGDGAGYMLGYPYAGKFNDNGAGNLHRGMKFGLLSPSTSHSLAVTGFMARANLVWL